MRMLPVIALTMLVAPAAENPLLMENDRVRVVKASTVPGQKSGMHVHKVNRVMVHLDAGQMRLVGEDGAVRNAVFTAGQVRWDPKVGLHTSENVGGTPYRIVEIELKNDSTMKPARLPIRKAGLFVADMENDQVRVSRLTLTGHDRTDPFKTTSPMISVDLATGETLWREPGKHILRNLTAKPINYLVVELK